MKIIKYQLLSKDLLFNKLRVTRLRGFGQPEVYKDAHMEITRSYIQQLAPCQNYVLSSRVADVLTLYDAFQKLNIDIFHLDEAVLFWLEGSNPEVELPIPLLPPIVEWSEVERRWLVNDGMHRIHAASTVGRTIHTVNIWDVPPEYPYYAFPLSGGWSEVNSVDMVPEERKAYRNPDDYKALFRDFNAVFVGVQKKRTK